MSSERLKPGRLAVEQVFRVGITLARREMVDKNVQCALFENHDTQSILFVFVGSDDAGMRIWHELKEWIPAHVRHDVAVVYEPVQIAYVETAYRMGGLKAVEDLIGRIEIE